MIEKRTLWAMAVGSGLAVANIYYNQPLLADMGRYFGVADRRMGLVSMLTQVGFATGMLLFVPLGDRLERRTFILTMLGAVVVALLGVAAAPSFLWLALASLVVGVTSRIYSIRPEARSRMNTAYMVTYFVGGAAGSSAGA